MQVLQTVFVMSNQHCMQNNFIEICGQFAYNKINDWLQIVSNLN